MIVLEQLQQMFALRGAAAYFGEPVSMAEHGLQAAWFARQAGAADALVVAALLHDIGHLIAPAPDDLADWTQDARHELSGSRWLSRHFGPEVCDPVRLHVPAKRYLCATDPSYLGRLSAASIHTLALQGGPMGDEEIAQFESEPHRSEAVLLRRCDDAGKMAGLRVPAFDAYAELILNLAAANRHRSG